MASTPLSATISSSFFYQIMKKLILEKQFLVFLLGFSGIVFLFSDNILINENNFLSALIIFFASTFYVIGGLLTLKSK